MTSLDLIVTCPYVNVHRIRKSVLPYHLVRCRKNQSSMKMQCPFDACHVIDEEYFENHVSNCASSGNIKRQQYILEPQRQLGVVSLETVNSLSVPVMKDWKEENVPTYDPWKHTANKNIIRCLIGGSKSEKRQFKLTERQRIEGLERNGIYGPNLKNNFKQRISKTHVHISQLIRNLSRLTLEDIDTLLKTIDISKLIISEVEKKNTFVEKKYKAEIVEKILVEKFKELMLHSFKNQIP